MTNQSRRSFLKNSVLATSALSLVNIPFTSHSKLPLEGDKLKVHIFSKHLQFLNYAEMAEAAADMGFDGVDLTVRPKGHVLPERVADDLPKAIEALRKAGLSPMLMTTAVDDATDPVDNAVLTTAATAGITHYRMNWLPYHENTSMPESLELHKKSIKELSALNKQLNLVGFYQNHAGMLIGSSLWEIWQVISEADPAQMGVQYDIRHAMVEGGTSWENGLRLVADRVKCLTLKDYRWTNKSGRSEVQDVPVGQGTVDFRKYFGLLRKYKINVPVTLHIEYPAGGAEHGATHISINKKEVFTTMKKDLQAIQRLWQES